VCAELVEELVDADERRAAVERVEDRLDEEHVDAAVDEPTRRLDVGILDLAELDGAIGRPLDVGRDGERDVGRAEGTGDEALVAGVGRHGGIGGLAGEAAGGTVDLVGELLRAVVALADAVAVEGVRLDDVGASVEILSMDVTDRVGLREAEQVVVAAQILGPVGEALPAVLRLAVAEGLDQRAHRAVHHDDALAHQLGERFGDGVGLVAVERMKTGVSTRFGDLGHGRPPARCASTCVATCESGWCSTRGVRLQPSGVRTSVCGA